MSDQVSSGDRPRADSGTGGDLAASVRAVSVHRGQGVQVGDGTVQYNQFDQRQYHVQIGVTELTWPVLVGRPPLLADAFQPRPTLEAAITSDSSPGTTLVIRGDGGTGKTQLAASSFRHRQATLDVALWVTASSREAIVASYADAWARVSPHQRDPGGNVDAERSALAFLSWLEVTDRAWIVVLDDVADPADLRRLWPYGPGGRALVTTRRRDAALVGHGRVAVDVGVYTPAEAVAFLTRKLRPGMASEVLDEAEELAQDVGLLPLAVGQASSVILDEAITCRQYRARFADRGRTLDQVFDAETGEDYDRTLSTTWKLSMERADALAPAGLAGRLLRLAAVLDPNGAPEAAYLTSAALTYVATDPAVAPVRTGDPRPPTVTPDDASRALRNLHRVSLVTRDAAASGWAVRMHAMAQRAALEELPPLLLSTTVRAAADSLAELWPEVARDPDLEQSLRSSVTALRGRHPDALWERGAHEVLLLAGRSLGEAGQVAAARDYFVELVETASTRIGPVHPDTLAARSQLGAWAGQAGDAAGAVRLSEGLLADANRTLGPDATTTLTARGNYAWWRGTAGDAAGAAMAYQELVPDFLTVLGRDHPETLRARHGLAWWRGRAGNAAGAAAAYRDLLPDVARNLGSDHPETLRTRHDLARWQGVAGDAAGASAAFQDLLPDTVRVMGSDHPETLRTRHNLARWRGVAGDAAGAAQAYEELLPDTLRVLGADHPHNLRTRSNIAWWRGMAGDPAWAASTCEELLPDMVQVLGPDHPDTLRTRHDMAKWRGEAGDAATAAAACEELLVDRLRVLGPDHPDTLATRDDLARWRGDTGDAASAAAAYAELLADRLRVLGPEHPRTKATQASLTAWQERAGWASP